jgi:putative transposase
MEETANYSVKQPFTINNLLWKTPVMLTMNYTYRIYPDAIEQTEMLE